MRPAPSAPAEIEGLSAEALDALPYGVILLDRNLVVKGYNRAESQESGIPMDRVVGRHFFDVVAPCANNPEFRGSVERVMRRGAGGSETFRYVYNAAGRRPRPVTITVYGAMDGGAWIVAA